MSAAFIASGLLNDIGWRDKKSAKEKILRKSLDNLGEKFLYNLVIVGKLY